MLTMPSYVTWSFVLPWWQIWAPGCNGPPSSNRSTEVFPRSLPTMRSPFNSSAYSKQPHMSWFACRVTPVWVASRGNWTRCASDQPLDIYARWSCKRGWLLASHSISIEPRWKPGFVSCDLWQRCTMSVSMPWNTFSIFSPTSRLSLVNHEWSTNLSLDHWTTCLATSQEWQAMPEHDCGTRRTRNRSASWNYGATPWTSMSGKTKRNGRVLWTSKRRQK